MSNVFNKKEFALLLKKAQGKRSLNQFAKESEISSAHISRLMRELIDTPPNPKTLRKLADVSHNSITYELFMETTGYGNLNEGQDITPSLSLEEQMIVEKVKNLSEGSVSKLLHYIDFLLYEEDKSTYK